MAGLCFPGLLLKRDINERLELHPVGHAEMLAFHTAQNLNQSSWSDF